MPTIVEPSAPTTLSAADLRPRGRVQPSPATWRDQTLYFFLPDRFSDGHEEERPLFDWKRPDQHTAADRRLWQESGRRFQGGTLKGIAGKLDYLKELGVTTLWIGPIWRQRPDLETYHGYGIQNFLERRSPIRHPSGFKRSGRCRPRPRDVHPPRHHLQPLRQQLVLR